MRTSRRAGLVGLAALTAACGATEETPSSGLVLQGVAVVDVEAGEIVRDQTIRIAGDRIVDMLTGTFPVAGSARVVDAGGLYAVPGLWDAHAHLSYWGEDALDLLIGHGVTTIRELGGDPDEIEAWKTAIDAGERLGPTMFWSGPFFEGPEGGDEYRWTVASPDEAREQAQRLLDRGVDFLKIQPRIGRAEVEALVEVARERGTSVVGHVPEGLTAIAAAAMGLRSIEHLSPYMGLSDEATQATIAALLEHGAWVSPALYSMVAQVDVRGESRADSRVVQRAYQLIRELHAAGVPMLVGSNFAYREWPHSPGSALHGEMDVLVHAGIPGAEVLRMTTLGNATFLGVDPSEVRLAPGARADLVLLEADPLQDIGNTRRLAGVVLRGRYFDTDELAGLRAPDPREE